MYLMLIFLQVHAGFIFSNVATRNIFVSPSDIYFYDLMHGKIIKMSKCMLKCLVGSVWAVYSAQERMSRIDNSAFVHSNFGCQPLPSQVFLSTFTFVNGWRWSGTIGGAVKDLVF